VLPLLLGIFLGESQLENALFSKLFDRFVYFVPLLLFRGSHRALCDLGGLHVFLVLLNWSFQIILTLVSYVENISGFFRHSGTSNVSVLHLPFLLDGSFFENLKSNLRLGVFADQEDCLLILPWFVLVEKGSLIFVGEAVKGRGGHALDEATQSHSAQTLACRVLDVLWVVTWSSNHNQSLLKFNLLVRVEDGAALGLRVVESEMLQVI